MIAYTPARRTQSLSDSQVEQARLRFTEKLLDGRYFPKPAQNVGLCSDGGYDEPPTPSEATTAPPGSEAKIEIMRRRIERGEHLHHPADEKIIARLAHSSQRGSGLD